MLPGLADRPVPAGVQYESAGTRKVRDPAASKRKGAAAPLAVSRERPPDAPGGRPSARSQERTSA